MGIEECASGLMKVRHRLSGQQGTIHRRQVIAQRAGGIVYFITAPARDCLSPGDFNRSASKHCAV
jgi:hypothetical protein